MKRTLLLIGLICSLICSAQEEDWGTYIAEYEGKPGTTLVDMGLKSSAPLSGYPYILVTGVKYKNCREDGFPEQGEFEKLYAISDAIGAKLKSLKLYKMAGTFTHNCERLDYYYISDTSNLRNNLASFYKTKFPSYTYYISIKTDKDWNAYLDFLYPSEITLEYMSNQKVLNALTDAGDKLVEPRSVDHWAYFGNETDRNCYINFVKKSGFKVEATEINNEQKLKYSIHFSRVDKVDIESITNVTIDLRKSAKKCNGEYDGWESVVVK